MLIDLHKDTSRQGPCGDSETKIALDLAMIDTSAPLKVAYRLWNGSFQLTLARHLNANITAVDLLEKFLEILLDG